MGIKEATAHFSRQLGTARPCIEKGLKKLSLITSAEDDPKEEPLLRFKAEFLVLLEAFEAVI